MIASRFNALRAAAGGPRDLVRKLGEVVVTARTLLDRRERRARLRRLVDAGLVHHEPTDWQMWLATHHMMFGYILPSNLEFYEHYEVPHWWHQLLRAVEAPATMMDPIGLGISEDVLRTHLVQVVHASAGYDVALLCMFEGGLDRLREALQQVIAGVHPKQATIQALLERDDYPARLLEAVDRFAVDPERHWRCDTVPAPEGCETLFDWGIETFGSPGRLMAYAVSLPETPMASLRAWLRGELRLPSPQPATTA